MSIKTVNGGPVSGTEIIPIPNHTAGVEVVVDDVADIVNNTVRLRMGEGRIQRYPLSEWAADTPTSGEWTATFDFDATQGALTGQDNSLEIELEITEEPITPTVGVFPGTNLRWWPGDGTRVEGSSATVPASAGGENWAAFYSALMAERVAHSPNHFAVAVPLVVRKISWSAWLVNDGTGLTPSTPTADQRDPTSSLYNQDVMANTLAALDHFDSLGMKMGLSIPDVHTAQKRAVPKGLRTNEEWAWEGDEVGKWRVRYDNPGMIDLLVNFFYAIQLAFGDHPALHGIVSGEYFLQLDGNEPATLDVNEYRLQRGKIFWQRFNAERWVRADGTRCCFYQTHPQLSGGSTRQDLIDNDIGVSESDTDMFTNGVGANGKADPFGEAGSIPENLQRLDGIVPLMANGDTRYAREGRQSTWPAEWVGVGNSPFDLVSNLPGGEYKGLITPQMFYWYHGRLNASSVEDGPIPLNSIVLRTDESTHQNEANVRAAHREHGHGGTFAATFGAAPAVIS